ncbi:unnamed protein product [Linum trigynum]|uniref:Uncharacterized protein n=1 Tax=Linum trigynum TaxID=586398 RepID=A0AAV2F9E0_9ROSI
MELNVKLGKDSGMPLKDGSRYRSLVGSLIYLTHTRPDISYAVHIISQFMFAPTDVHLHAAHRILRYLQGTCTIGLYFPSTGTFDLAAYSDSNYAGCINTRRSTTSWGVRMAGYFVSCRCKKQDKVSKSSMEAEYRAMSDVSSELIWLRHLLADLDVHC